MAPLIWLLVLAQGGKVEPLREQVRELATVACAPCHLREHPDAKPKALAIFDVRERDWSAKLDARRRDVFKSRMKDKVDAKQLALVQAWMDAEPR